MIDESKIQPLPQKFQDKYDMACMSDDMTPWFKVNGNWISMQVIETFAEMKVYYGLKPEVELLEILTVEYDVDTAEEVMRAIEQYYNDR